MEGTHLCICALFIWMLILLIHISLNTLYQEGKCDAQDCDIMRARLYLASLIVCKCSCFCLRAFKQSVLYLFVSIFPFSDCIDSVCPSLVSSSESTQIVSPPKARLSLYSLSLSSLNNVGLTALVLLATQFFFLSYFSSFQLCDTLSLFTCQF